MNGASDMWKTSNTHTCVTGVPKGEGEKGTENSLLKNFKFNEKLYVARSSVNLRINTKKPMPRCSLVSLWKDQRKL